MSPEKDQKFERMAFRGNKVWVLAGPDGAPLVTGGKVLVKYNPDQPHEYRVNADDVFPLKNGEVPPQSKPAKKTPRKKTVKPDLPREEMENAVVIFTDGASSGNPGPSGIGVVLRYKGRTKEISRYIGDTTNNVAELTAILEGLLAVKKKDLPVRLFTDSSYAQGLLTKGWKPKKNIELVARIRQVMKRFPDIRIIKVKGHAGDPDNERADHLATQGAAGKTE